MVFHQFTTKHLPELLTPDLIMHPYIQEAIFVSALVAGLVYAYRAIPQGLQDVKDAARSPFPEPPGGPPAKQIDPDAEDRIELSTLRALSEGHSFELRNAAIRIVSARAINDSTRTLLLRHLSSKHYHDRDNAINALWLLFYGSETPNDTTTTNARSRFQDKDFFNAIVTALLHTLPYHKTTSDSNTPYPPSPIRPLTRPPHEASLFILLTTALRGSIRDYPPSSIPANLDLALDAGLVNKWLVSYPFPCTLPQYAKLNYHKSDVSALFGTSRYAYDDPAMHDIMRMILSSSKGMTQLRTAGLRASRIKENISSEAAAVSRTRARRSSPAGSAGSWASSTQRHADNISEGLGGRTDRGFSRIFQRAETDPDHDVRMTNGEDTAGELPMVDLPGLDSDTTRTRRPGSLSAIDSRLGWTPLRPPLLTERWDDEPHPRVFDRSAEEVNLRRRNRETMVVVERGQPLGRDNILRRDFSDSAVGLSDADRAFMTVVGERRAALGMAYGTRRSEVGEGQEVEVCDGEGIAERSNGENGEGEDEEGSMPDLADAVTGGDAIDVIEGGRELSEGTPGADDPVADQQEMADADAPGED